MTELENYQETEKKYSNRWRVFVNRFMNHKREVSLTRETRRKTLPSDWRCGRFHNHKNLNRTNNKPIEKSDCGKKNDDDYRRPNKRML